jgi:hypothetical protein
MSSNDFPEDSFFSKKYRYLLQILYKQYSYEGRYVFIDKSRFSMLIQKRLKTDVVAQLAVDESVGVEEKIARWPEKKNKPHTGFFLETDSCTKPGYESKGWMYDGQADYLLYAFEIKGVGLDVYIIPFQPLKHWFWQILEKCPDRYPTHTMPGKNRSRGRIATIADVIAEISSIIRYCITFAGDCYELSLNENIFTFHRRIENIVAIPSSVTKKKLEENGYIDPEEDDNFLEVRQRVEEILAVQDIEQMLLWQEEMERQ